MKKHPWLSIGQVAALSELSVATIRFYEEKELIGSTRTAGNQRRYHSSVIRRLAIIKIAQRVGISLQELKSLFITLPNHKSATKKDWEKMSKQWQEQLNAKIEILLLLRDQLDQCIGCGCLSMKQCPLRQVEIN
jgi:MerR family transcriptional regulator, redox-sensitive transcriptional activator SoxR